MKNYLDRAWSRARERESESVWILSWAQRVPLMCVYVYMHMDSDFECLSRAKNVLLVSMCSDVHVVMCCVDCVRVLSLCAVSNTEIPTWWWIVYSELLVSVLSICAFWQGKTLCVYCTCDCFTYIFFSAAFFVRSIYFVCSSYVVIIAFFPTLLRFSFVVFFSVVGSIWSSLFSMLNLSTLKCQ